MTQQARLVYMANQVARNFAIQGDDIAARATADHIASFWDPRMKHAILADGSGLSTVATAAVEILRRDHHPAHVTSATIFPGDHGSDAG
ncbi:formate dehydrogenase subunit delta [Sphingomonas sp. LT1P40]|uniref:formate dehydrogenase subunit delta n=1 Tax=Alteristakelama amylovorans TaxID=3096166 RepID=UPI002FC993EA